MADKSRLGLAGIVPIPLVRNLPPLEVMVCGRKENV